MQRKPYATIREYQPPGQQRIVGLNSVEEPPPYLSLFIGDAVQNLRAALDYLTWELVLANHQSPTDHTAFPIFKRADGYRKHASRMVGGVSEPARTLIESVQPYHAGDRVTEHPLAMLDRLARIDKHRHLLLGTAWIVGADRASFSFIAGPVFLFRDPWPPEAEVDVYAQQALVVALDEREIPRGRSSVVLVNELLEFVRDRLLPRFEAIL